MMHQEFGNQRQARYDIRCRIPVICYPIHYINARIQVFAYGPIHRNNCPLKQAGQVSQFHPLSTTGGALFLNVETDDAQRPTRASHRAARGKPVWVQLNSNVRIQGRVSCYGALRLLRYEHLSSWSVALAWLRCQGQGLRLAPATCPFLGWLWLVVLI